MSASRLLALSIGASRLTLAEFSRVSADLLCLERYADGDHSADWATASTWPATLTHALAALAARAGLAGAVELVVPAHLSWSKVVTIPHGSAAGAAPATLNAAEHIPVPLAEVIWDETLLGDDGAEAQVLLTAVKAAPMTSLCAAVTSAGFSIERAVPVAAALEQAYRLFPSSSGEPSLCVQVGARSTTLVFRGGDRCWPRTLAIGGNDITAAIASDLKITEDAAETLKRRICDGDQTLPPTSPARAAVERASAAFQQRLPVEIRRALLHHRREKGSLPPSALWLTGGGARVPGLVEQLGEQLTLRVERFNPLEGVHVTNSARAAGAVQAAPALAKLIGVAARLRTGRVVEPNLLPRRVAAAAARTRRRPWVLATAALAAAALLPPIAWRHEQLRLNREHLARIEAQVAPWRQNQARMDSERIELAAITAQIAALRPVYERRGNWRGLLGDLQWRLAEVEDVWIDRLRLGASVEGPTAMPGMAESSREQAISARTHSDRLILSGRLLDVQNPTARVSEATVQQVRRLLASLRASPYIASVDHEEYDNSRDGLLRFDFTFALNPERPL